MEPDWMDEELAELAHSEQGAMDAAHCEAIARAESARDALAKAITAMELLERDGAYWRRKCEDAEMGEFRADLRARRWRMAAWITLGALALVVIAGVLR